VVHTHTELRLRLELRGDRLHIAVRDGSPRLLHLVTAPDPEAEGGRGLWLVEQLGGGWGQPPSRRRQGRLVHAQPLTPRPRHAHPSWAVLAAPEPGSG
jgi:hypothetical protein